MIQNCFLCTGEVQINSSSSANPKENSFLLCHILELTHLGNDVNNEINYCPGCVKRILSIGQMLEELERLEKKVLDEKYLIEGQLKANATKLQYCSQNDSRNSSEQLTVEIATELSLGSIQSMLTKIRRKEIGRRKLSTPSNVRIMENVTIPRPVIPPPVQQRFTMDNQVRNDDEAISSWNLCDISNLEVEVKIEPGLISDRPVLIDPLQDSVVLSTISDTGIEITDSILPGMDGESGEGEFSQFQEIHQGQEDNESFLYNMNVANFRRHNSTPHTSRSQTIRRIQPALRPKKCEECGRILATRLIWKNHILTVHRKQYKLKCTMCNYGCQYQSDLDRHMFKHSDERKFECHLCHSSFKLRKHLIYHLHRKHSL